MSEKPKECSMFTSDLDRAGNKRLLRREHHTHANKFPKVPMLPLKAAAIHNVMLRPCQTLDQKNERIKEHDIAATVMTAIHSEGFGCGRFGMNM